MNHYDEPNPEAIALIEPEEITRVETAAVAVLARAETEVQIDAAHRHPRSIKRFLSEATGLATYNQATAEACIYALPRGGKTISGPSVRLAEICASAYGNMHVAARVLDADETTIAAQGVAWDIEKNVRITVESKRKITTKQGRRYDEDMIVMTGNAAASIALRNAIFRVVPRALVDQIYNAARAVAVGDARTFDARRTDVLARLGKMGVTPDRILARVDRRAVEDVTPEDLEVLIGLGTAVKAGGTQIDEAFPPPPAAEKIDSAPEGRRTALRQPRKPPQPDPDGVVEREPGAEG
jgi:hypothetical protein